jgi:hypothetical protein
VAKISIVPRGGAGGLTFFAPNEDRVDSGLYTRQFLEGQVGPSSQHTIPTARPSKQEESFAERSTLQHKNPVTARPFSSRYCPSVSVPATSGGTGVETQHTAQSMFQQNGSTSFS